LTETGLPPTAPVILKKLDTQERIADEIRSLIIKGDKAAEAEAEEFYRQAGKRLEELNYRGTRFGRDGCLGYAALRSCLTSSLI
jgi:hypothetical protein